MPGPGACGERGFSGRGSLLFREKTVLPLKGKIHWRYPFFMYGIPDVGGIRMRNISFFNGRWQEISQGYQRCLPVHFYVSLMVGVF
jgi:hypothetical protein